MSDEKIMKILKKANPRIEQEGVWICVDSVVIGSLNTIRTITHKLESEEHPETYARIFLELLAGSAKAGQLAEMFEKAR